MKTYLITEAQRDSLLAYLVKRPFEEVEGGVTFLRALPEAPQAEKPAGGLELAGTGRT